MSDYIIVSPEGLEPDLGLLMATLRDGCREWRKYLESPSVEAITWSPYPGGPNIGGLLLHIIGAEMYWLYEVALGQGQPADHPAKIYDNELDQFDGTWPIPPAQPIEWYFQLQDENRAKMIQLIREHGNPDKLFDRRDRHVSYRWIVAHLVEHDSYHGGQAVLLHEMYLKTR